MTVLFLSIFIKISGFFFVGPDNNYSVLLPEGMQLVQIDTLSDRTVNHVFVGKNATEGFDYSFSISVVGSESKNLLLSSTIEQYEKDCKCQVVATEKVEFANFRGVKYEIEKNVDDTKLGGNIYISESKNGKSINVVSMALKEASNQLDSSLKPILNTVVLNFE